MEEKNEQIVPSQDHPEQEANNSSLDLTPAEGEVVVDTVELGRIQEAVALINKLHELGFENAAGDAWNALVEEEVAYSVKGVQQSGQLKFASDRFIVLSWSFEDGSLTQGNTQKDVVLDVSNRAIVVALFNTYSQHGQYPDYNQLDEQGESSAEVETPVNSDATNQVVEAPHAVEFAPAPVPEKLVHDSGLAEEAAMLAKPKMDKALMLESNTQELIEEEAEEVEEGASYNPTEDFYYVNEQIAEESNDKAKDSREEADKVIEESLQSGLLSEDVARDAAYAAKPDMDVALAKEAEATQLEGRIQPYEGDDARYQIESDRFADETQRTANDLRTVAAEARDDAERAIYDVAHDHEMAKLDKELEDRDEEKDEDPLAGDVDKWVHPDETRTDAQIEFDDKHPFEPY